MLLLWISEWISEANGTDGWRSLDAYEWWYVMMFTFFWWNSQEESQIVIECYNTLCSLSKCLYRLVHFSCLVDATFWGSCCFFHDYFGSVSFTLVPQHGCTRTKKKSRGLGITTQCTNQLPPGPGSYHILPLKRHRYIQPMYIIWTQPILTHRFSISLPMLLLIKSLEISAICPCGRYAAWEVMILFEWELPLALKRGNYMINSPIFSLIFQARNLHV